ncbi:MAG: hypothetical protein JWM44_1267 [Bacilli bacterium]|nr:hypothetical protein [Bacilli bacterium]
MVITLYLFFCWLLFGILIRLAKEWPHKHIAFVFLFVDFVNTNIPYLLADPFKFYKLSETPSGYVSFSLYQSLIIPALMTIIVNAYLQYPAVPKRITVIFVSVGVLVCFEFLSRLLNLVIYSGLWRFAALIGYRLILLYLTIIALNCFRRMCKR